jgi:hypothetical protein
MALLTQTEDVRVISGPMTHRRIDITGKTFGLLSVLSYAWTRNGRVFWTCRCVCGTTKEIESAILRYGSANSCGCKGILQIEPGMKFGRLTVVSKSVGRLTYWNCICDCGKRTQQTSNQLRKGKAKSCGCYRSEIISVLRVTHGEYRHGKTTAEIGSFKSAKSRCTNPRNKKYQSYGGRGIEFRFESFEQFLAELGRKPSPSHSLDRYPDNDGHYEPGNVRWATPKQQANNTRASRRAACR